MSKAKSKAADPEAPKYVVNEVLGDDPHYRAGFDDGTGEIHPDSPVARGITATEALEKLEVGDHIVEDAEKDEPDAKAAKGDGGKDTEE